MNIQTRTVSEVLVFIFLALSATAVLTLSVATTNLTLPFIISGAALIVVMIATASIMGTSVTGAPWVPTRQELVKKALEMAELKPGELLYDLGSGDGRIVITAARDFGVRAIGVEIDPFRVLYSRLKIRWLGLTGKARIIRSNFFNVELRDADAVVLYLVQETNDKLQSKLEKELTKPDCRVISIVWKFNGWQLLRADEDGMINAYRPHP